MKNKTKRGKQLNDAKPRLLLVDFSNLLYRAVFANQSLSHRGIFTGGIFGFINMLTTTVNRYSIDRVVICKDCKPYRRFHHYKKYKQDRHDRMSEDDIKRIATAKKQITNFIRKLKFSCAIKVGYEADDFIGCFCRHRRSRYDGIFIMSNDSDFYQLLGGIAGSVFLVTTGGLYGKIQFKEDFPEINPEDWPRIIALKGSHNGVAGIKGVGDKTAVKLVASGITNEEIFEKYKHLPRHVELREALAKFPYPRAPRLTLPRVEPIGYDVCKLEGVCNRYGIQFRTAFHDALLRLSK